MNLVLIPRHFLAISLAISLSECAELSYGLPELAAKGGRACRSPRYVRHRTPTISPTISLSERAEQWLKKERIDASFVRNREELVLDYRLIMPINPRSTGICRV